MPGTPSGARKAAETKKLRYGNDYYVKLADDLKEKHGPNYFSELGSRGGAKSGNRPMKDPAYASRLGKISAEKRRQKKLEKGVDSN